MAASNNGQEADHGESCSQEEREEGQGEEESQEAWSEEENNGAQGEAGAEKSQKNEQEKNRREEAGGEEIRAEETRSRGSKAIGAARGTNSYAEPAAGKFSAARTGAVARNLSSVHASGASCAAAWRRRLG
jgi:hypothetical protein